MTSFKFLAFIFGFIPVVMLIYHWTCPKYRWIVLLASSYIFFFISSGTLLIFLIISTISIYLCALGISRLKEKCISAAENADKSEAKIIKIRYSKYQKAVVFCAVLINLGILIVLKYSQFITENVNQLFKLFGSAYSFNSKNYALPIGISFYTLSAISYVVDVYRGTTVADKHLGKVALFLGFFPQIMEGPICRFNDTANQLMAGKNLEYKNICFGFQRIGYGMAKRMLVADRVNNYVTNTFSSGIGNNSITLIIGSVLYTFQLYMDFSGTLDIVIGTAEIFGITLPENFNNPFFSETLSEFWKRWHITLGSWFSDYIFFPISMSKPLKKVTKQLRKKIGNYYGPILSSSIALIVVWICNGLWHGSGWQYLFFGFYFFILILIGNLIEPLKNLFFEKTKLSRQSVFFKIYRILRTAFLFNLGEIFFRSESLKYGFEFISNIINGNHAFNREIFNALDIQDYVLLVVCIISLIVIGVLKEKKINIRQKISEMHPALRMSIYVALFLVILIFGGYGYGYTYIEPIYAKF